jgi:hypothetical protein
VTLDPSKSKCPGDLEICCLHPDFEKAPAGPVPAPVPIPIPLPPPVPAVPVNLSPQPNVGPVDPPLPPVGPVNPPLPPPGPVDPLSPPGPISPGPGNGGPNNNSPPYVPPVIIEPAAPKSYEARCGQRHTGGIGVRIQNSKEDSGTQFGEWPNMCAVLNR